MEARAAQARSLALQRCVQGAGAWAGRSAVASKLFGRAPPGRCGSGSLFRGSLYFVRMRTCDPRAGTVVGNAYVYIWITQLRFQGRPGQIGCQMTDQRWSRCTKSLHFGSRRSHASTPT